MAFDISAGTAIADRKSNASLPDQPVPAVHLRSSSQDPLGEIDVDLKDRLSLHIERPRPTIIRSNQVRLVTLQTWEGFVQEVGDEIFTARLADLTDKASLDEEVVELSFTEVDPDDIELVRPGAVFRWIVGYHQAPFSRRESVSSVVFRRLPAWTAEDLKQAHQRAETRADAFQWE